ncbi:MAG: hypothetical protein DHS20C18_43980 [Saprospiraceae bacterium]|nr:MAG: hypothetical protein DHS20C18_43980 [Saprospiraceae bacterium]
MGHSLTAEAIIFAINSAIKLGRNVQKAYAESLKSREILLPLPRFSGEPPLLTIEEFFNNKDKIEGGARFVEKIERLQILHLAFGQFGFTEDDDKLEYISYYNHFFELQQIDNQAIMVGEGDNHPQRIDDSRLNVDDLLSLLRIRQYENPKLVKTSALQIVAGTLVEIGIDYFNQVPGALNTNSSFGKAMKSFLSALDDIPFSDAAEFKDMSELILPKLFITAAEVIGTFSSEISSDEKLQQFIQASTKGLAKDLFERVGKIKSDNRFGSIQKEEESDKSIRWGQLVLRSMVKNAGTYVFNSPADLFDTNEGGSHLIQSTGGALLEIILSDPHKIDISKAFNIESLDRMVKVALNVVAEHPSLIVAPNGQKQEAFRNIIIGISKAIADTGIQRPDFLPELVRLVLEHTAGNLEMLWLPKRSGEKHLLVIAIRQLLEVVSEPIPNAKWEPNLAKGQLIMIAENILDEVVENPEWVRNREEEDISLLQQVLKAVFGALATIPKRERFNGEVVALLIQISLRTVTNSQKVLDTINWSGHTEKVVILNKALDLIFTYTFNPQKVNPTERIGLLIDLVEYVSETVIARHPNKKGLLLVDLILFKAPGVDYSGGFNRELADQLINASLGVLNEHPHLVSNQVSLQNIITGVAEVLDASTFRKSGILPELLRLVLENTGRNIQLIFKAKSDSPQYMMVLALEQLMSHLSYKRDTDRWQPVLTSGEAMGLVELILDDVVMHPEWVIPKGDGSLYNDVLTAVFAAMANIPKKERLNADTLAAILQTCMRTAATSQQVLNPIQWGEDTEKTMILHKALDLIFDFTFKQVPDSGNNRIGLVTDMLEYIMEVVLTYHPDNKGLILVDLILFNPKVDFSAGFDEELADHLIASGLEIMEAHPELTTKHKSLQLVIKDIAGALDASSFDNPQLLPEFVRLVLQSSASNIHLILNTTSDTPRFLLVGALKKMLTVLSNPNNSTDPWSPSLTAAQVLEIVEDSTEELVNHPEWLVERADGLNLFEQVLDSIFLTLAKAPKEERFSPKTLNWIIQNATYTAARHESVLVKVKWGTGDDEATILQQALDLVYSYVLNLEDRASHLSMLETLLEYTFETILRQHPDKRSLVFLHLILFENNAFHLNGGFNEEQANRLIDTALDVVAQYPDLVSKDRVFQKILRDTSLALRDSKLSRPELLPELIRLSLEQINGNLDAIMDMRINGPRNLLAVAIGQVLKAISEKPSSRNKWKLNLTEAQMLETTRLVMAKVVTNPQWVNDELIFVVMKALFAALEAIPQKRKIGYATFSVLVEAAMQAVAFRKQLVIKFIDLEGDEKQLALTYSLEALFMTIYDENGDSAGSWTLSQTATLNAIIECYLLRLSEQGATKENVKAAVAKVEGAIQKINADLAFTLEDLLVELEG